MLPVVEPPTLTVPDVLVVLGKSSAICYSALIESTSRKTWLSRDDCLGARGGETRGLGRIVIAQSERLVRTRRTGARIFAAASGWSSKLHGRARVEMAVRNAGNDESENWVSAKP